MEPLYLLDWLHLLKFISRRSHGGESMEGEMCAPVNVVIYEVFLEAGLPQGSVQQSTQMYDNDIRGHCINFNIWGLPLSEWNHLKEQLLRCAEIKEGVKQYVSSR